MRFAIAAELAAGFFLGVWFIVAYWSSPWGSSAAGRHMMAVAAVMAAEMGTLLLLALGVPVPMWLFVVGYGLADLVVAHRLLLLHRARHERPGD